jgi:hypothetical protein
MKRIVRLLGPKRELTPRQIAQRRYQQSAKGKAAQERYRAKVAPLPEFKAKKVRYSVEYQRRNITTVRVYKRIWWRMKKRRTQQANVA